MTWEPGFVVIWRSSQEDVVFLFSGKCHKVSHCKVVQTLKVENQLENSLPFWPLEQSCDIRGGNVWKPNFKTTNIWNFEIWGFIKVFAISGLNVSTRKCSVYFREVFNVSLSRNIFNGREFFHNFLLCTRRSISLPRMLSHGSGNP